MSSWGVRHLFRTVRPALVMSIVALMGVEPRVAGGEPQVFVGVITDDMCADGNHAAMRMGSNDEECAKACVDAHAAAYVMFDGTRAYELTDQKTAATFAGKRVRISGTLDARGRRIAVESIRLAS